MLGSRCAQRLRAAPVAGAGVVAAADGAGGVETGRRLAFQRRRSEAPDPPRARGTEARNRGSDPSTLFPRTFTGGGQKAGLRRVPLIGPGRRSPRRAYVLLSRYPFFSLHFSVLRAVLAEERLGRIRESMLPGAEVRFTKEKLLFQACEADAYRGCAVVACRSERRISTRRSRRRNQRAPRSAQVLLRAATPAPAAGISPSLSHGLLVRWESRRGMGWGEVRGPKGRREQI